MKELRTKKDALHDSICTNCEKGKLISSNRKQADGSLKMQKQPCSSERHLGGSKSKVLCDDNHVYCDCGDGFPCVLICQKYHSVYSEHVWFIVSSLYLTKALI